MNDTYDAGIDSLGFAKTNSTATIFGAAAKDPSEEVGRGTWLMVAGIFAATLVVLHLGTRG